MTDEIKKEMESWAKYIILKQSRRDDEAAALIARIDKKLSDMEESQEKLLIAARESVTPSLSHLMQDLSEKIEFFRNELTLKIETLEKKFIPIKRSYDTFSGFKRGVTLIIGAVTGFVIFCITVWKAWKDFD